MTKVIPAADEVWAEESGVRVRVEPHGRMFVVSIGDTHATVAGYRAARLAAVLSRGAVDEATASEPTPVSTEVRHCPRCGETHAVPATRLTFPADVCLQVGDKRVAIAHWTHWMMCPTFNEPIMYGLVLDYPGEYGVIVERDGPSS